MKYDYKAVEAKWQKVWEDEKTFHVEIDHKKPKFYALVEFPYPSGAGLHVGHPRSYTALDVVSRKRRKNGYNVLYPMGWDAFGLPTENFAMKNHIHPAIVTKSNVDHFRSQLKALGFSFDWDREINTTDPEYYKWTQWIFLQLYKHGLAYKKEMNVNWCTGCKCVLANEEVVNGVCERCGSEVVHRVKSQWMLKITAYADKLIDGLDGLDYIERVSTQQKNWIGRSHGAEVNFGTTAGDTLTVYTTRPDTLFGATYMVISPEHPMIEQWADKLNNIADVRAYREEAARKSDFERTELNKDKTGVRIDGIYSGYLASPEQAELLSQTIDCIAAPDTLVIVDPVMADNGIYYSQIDERMCAAFRRLLSRADVITPNITEAALLAGLPYEPGTHSDAYLAQLFRALGALGAGVVTVTGVRPQPDVIGNVACDCRTGEMYASMRPAHPGLFYGTGDVFASALAGLLVRGAPLSDALETATALTDESICRSLWRDTPRHFGVDFEGALPAYIRRVEKIFEA